MNRIREISVRVLRNHVGAAAEFIVDDAIAAVGDSARRSEVEVLLMFLISLGKQLPPSVNASGIEKEIRTELKVSR